MKDIHNNLIFHLHNPRKDGEGIDLVIYRFDDNAKRCYTINEVNKYIKEGQDLNKSEKNYNSETIDGLNEVRAKYKTMLEQNPDSPKIHKILKATADIIRHFQEWFDDNEIEFPANYTPNIYLKDFKYMDDYYRVWMKDKKFDLTQNQAYVIEILHEAHKSGKPYLNFSSIVFKVGGEADKMSDIFKKNKDAMHALIHYNKSLTQYKLNIDK
tara:strand:- start:160 stop:795 length:636 start_codon:yes stop_codon:yes gene_type:complete